MDRKEKGPSGPLFVRMDPNVVSAIISASAIVIVNIIANVILSARQTAVLELKIQQLENTLKRFQEIPDRVTRLETQMTAVNESLREMRLS
mgnify:CR=1 FL=1